MIYYKTLRIQQISIFLLFTLLALTPFNPVLAGFLPLSGVIKDILCLLICIISISSGKLYCTKSDFGVVLYLLLVIVGIAFANNSNTSLKIDMFRYRVEYMLTFFLFFSSYKDSEEGFNHLIDKAFNIIYCSTVIVAMVGIIEFFNPSLIHSIYGNSITKHLSLLLGGARTNRLMSTLGNPINLGLFMSIGIVSLLYFINKDSTRHLLTKIILIASGVAMIFVTFFSFSRTAYVTLFAIIAAYYVIEILFSIRRTANKIYMLLFGTILLIATYYLVNNNASISYRLGSINSQAYTSNLRYLRIVDALQNRDNNLLTILFGSGVGKLVGSSGQYVFEFGFASLFYESGIVGLAIFLIYIIRSVFLAIKLRKTYNSYSPLSKILCCFNIGFFVAMFAGDVYAQYPFNLFFWLFTICSEYIRKIDSFSTSHKTDCQ